MSDPEGYKPYMAANRTAFGKFGARYLVRGGRCEVTEGRQRSRTVVLEFPSYEAALACYRSPEYQAANESARRQGRVRPGRHRGLTTASNREERDMAKGYWIGRVEVNNEEGYKPYAAANPAIFKKFGAQVRRARRQVRSARKGRAARATW